MKSLFCTFFLLTGLLISFAIWADQPVDENCLTCHFKGQTDLLTHTPAGENMCDVCHEKNDKHYSINYSSEVCLNCHDKQDDLPFRHKALDLPKQCLTCHNPHGSDQRYFLKMPTINLCTSCHDGMTKNPSSKTAHKVAYAEGSCVNCHLPHASQHKKLLKSSAEDLCLTCHNREMPYTGGYPRKEKFVKNIQKLVETSTYAHAPAKAKQCNLCHTPHQSGQWWLLKTELAPDPRNVASKNWSLVPDKFKMCFKCHNIDMLNENISNKETRYRNDKMVKRPWYRGGGTQLVRVNLHRLHGMSCSACHDVHGGERQHLIRKQWKPLPQGGTCGAGCHGDLDRWEVGVVYKRID